jgi:hypothetical protein
MFGSEERGAFVRDAFETATSGPASALPYQREMEAAFGRSFAEVKAHVGSEAARSGFNTTFTLSPNYFVAVGFNR